MVGHLTFLLENVNAYWILPGRTEARRPFGRRRQSRRDSSETDLKAVQWKVMESIHLHLNRFAASYLNTQGLNNSCLKSSATTLVDLTFQSRALRSFSLNQLRNLSL